MYNLLMACHLNLVLVYLPPNCQQIPIVTIVIFVVTLNLGLADLLLRNGLKSWTG